MTGRRAGRSAFVGHDAFQPLDLDRFGGVIHHFAFALGVGTGNAGARFVGGLGLPRTGAVLGPGLGLLFGCFLLLGGFGGLGLLLARLQVLVAGLELGRAGRWLGACCCGRACRCSG